ncbi:MAG: class I SAM-dependent methyltransferase [Acidimicrobiia bacterium]
MTSDIGEVERWSALKVWLFSLRNRTPKSNLAAVEWLSLTPPDRFLDLGCGLGAALEHAVGTGAALAGIDPSPTMVERASRRVPGAEVKVGSAEEIPFPDDRFTAVMAVATYHHWADPDAGFAEIRRVLAPGGRLLIVERRLKRNDGHGIDPPSADRLAAGLLRIGLASSEVDVRRVGRVDYLTISAAAPG